MLEEWKLIIVSGVWVDAWYPEIGDFGNLNEING